MLNRRTVIVAAVLAAAAVVKPVHAEDRSVVKPAQAEDKSIVVASTTSTQDSGLFDHILPLFKQKTGIDVKVVAQGTGQALDTGRRGDADVVFVHAKSAEERFLAEGAGVKRYPVMYNDFLLIGPKSDPAGIKGMNDVAKAFQTIKEKQAPFISRGDRSGTHIAELTIWNKDAGIDIDKEKGPWYKSIGQGMGAALNTAAASMPMSCRIAALGSHSRIRVICKSSSKVTNAFSINMGSCWSILTSIRTSRKTWGRPS